MHADAAAIMLGRAEAVPSLTDIAGRLALYPARQQEVVGHWYLGVAAYRTGRQETSMAHLRRSLTLAAQYRHLHLLALELPVTAEVLQPALEQGLCPEAIAGLVQYANRNGLLAPLDRAPSAAPVVTAAGRLAEARTFSVEMLGLFRVMRGGREIDLAAGRSQKAVSLLKYLLANRGRSATREQILEAIWAEADPVAADRSFEVTLSALRKLAGGAIRRCGGAGQPGAGRRPDPRIRLPDPDARPRPHGGPGGRPAGLSAVRRGAKAGVGRRADARDP